MNRLIVGLALALGLATTATLIQGCEEEIAHDRTVEVDDETVTTKETTVRETREGDIEVERKTTEEKYDDGQVQRKETEVEKKTFPEP